MSCTGPRACYDESKRYGETLCVNFAQQYGARITIARPFNNYGPGLKITDRRVIPDLARNVLDGEDLTLLSDGAATRTFCYASDAVVGYYKVLVGGRAGEPYNVGTEEPEISVGELAERLARIGGDLLGYEGRVTHARSDEAAYLVIASLERAIAARPTEAALEPALSRLYVRMGMASKAEAFLISRLKANSKDGTARSELAFYYVGQKKYAAAISEYSRLIEEQPADATALNNLAWLYQRQGELGKARDLAQQANEIAPGDPSISDTLGWILLNQGEAERALAYLTAAKSAAPKNLDIQYHLAVALARIGRAGDARAMLESLLGSGGLLTDKADAEKLLYQLKRG